MRSISFIKPRFINAFVFVAILFCLSAHTTLAQVTAVDRGISGVLLVGKFRTQQQLNAMSPEDSRNTLITELVGRTTDTVGHYQSLHNADLAGAGALLVYLRETRSRTDQQIKTMSADDMRNSVIIEVAAQTGRGRDLQALNNMELIQLVLGRNPYVRGVLLVGKFRTQQQLNAMSREDWRNTLITELVGRTKDTVGHYQSLADADLAGAGALLVYLRDTGSRTDQQIKTMSADDMRNTVIVEVAAQRCCRDLGLQALSNMNLLKLVLERPTACLN
jgi:2-keto-3-deoxy-galactonokinase